MPTLSLREPTSPLALEAWRRALTAERAASDLTVLVVFAHPDDESVGLGAVLPILRDVWFLCVTDGSPRDLTDAHRAGCATRSAYALRRRAELEAALSCTGHRRSRLEFLDVADQEASLHLRDIVAEVAERIDRIEPDVVVTHPYEGGHPDHDSTAFAVHMACRSRRAIDRLAPIIVEMTSYHSDHGMVRFGEFLGASTRADMALVLDTPRRAQKRVLLDCYVSQADVLRGVPLAMERFRVAPDYSFDEAPHPGRLLYEQFSLGIDGVDWRRHARAALLGGLPAPLHGVQRRRRAS